MNKRGNIILEMIVKWIPNIIAVIILIAVLVGIWAIFFAKPKTLEMQNFNRVAEEMNILLKEKIDKKTCSDVRKIPIAYNKDNPHNLILYSAETSSIKKPSICVQYFEDNKWKEHCEPFEKVGDLNIKSNVILVTPDKSYVTIERTCAELSLS